MSFLRPHESNELKRFAPKIFLSAPGDVFQPAGRPISHRSENGAIRGAICFAQICDNELPCRQPLEAACRDRELFRADVFSKREKCTMPAEIIDCRSHALIDLDLLDAGIALYVENAIAFQQVIVEFLRAADVQDRVRVAIKLTDFL